MKCRIEKTFRFLASFWKSLLGYLLKKGADLLCIHLCLIVSVETVRRKEMKLVLMSEMSLGKMADSGLCTM